MKGNKLLCFFLVILVVYLFVVTMMSVYNYKKQVVENFVTSPSGSDQTTSASVISRAKDIIKNYIDERITELAAAEAEREAELAAASDGIIRDETYYEYGPDFQNFHSKYEQNLVKLLEKKFNLEDPDAIEKDEFLVRKNILTKRLESVRSKLTAIDTKANISMYETEDNKSIKNIHSGTKINVKEFKRYDSPTGSYILSANDGCLSYPKGGGLSDQDECVLADKLPDETPNPQLFDVHNITNDSEYNAHIQEIAPECKTFVSPSDNIKYPFKIVSPKEEYGKCLKLENENLSVVPCSNDEKQRYKFSNPISNCPT